MIEGILSISAFTDTLRSVAQKRRQGILQIEDTAGTKNIYFVAGKIVDYDLAGTTSAKLFLDKLISLGIVPNNEISNNENYNTISYEELFESLNLNATSFNIEAEYFQRLIQEHILDQLYELNLKDSDKFDFRPQIVANVGKFNPRISVGQYLLDLVALGELKNQLHDFISSNCELSLVNSNLESSFELQMLARAFESVTTLPELSEKSGLSSFNFLNTMQQLLQAGLVFKKEEIKPTEVAINKPAAVQEVFNVEADQPIQDSVSSLEVKPAESDLAHQDEWSEVKSIELPVAKKEELSTKNIVNGKVSLPAAPWKTLNARLIQSNRILNITLGLFILGAMLIIFQFWGKFLGPFTTM